MATIIHAGDVRIYQPELRYEGGVPKAIGVCAVHGTALSCYGWKGGQILLIMDMMKPEETGESYLFYVVNLSNDSAAAWVQATSITFSLGSNMLRKPEGYQGVS